MSWTIGVDVGGTFTDFCAFNESTGTMRLGKIASTPGNPALAVIEGIRNLTAREEIDIREVRRVSHGTTVGTNALIQRRGGTVALITTRGFRDLLEIGRQTRPHMFDLNEDNPPPLVPRHLRFEIDERLDADGNVLIEPRLDQIRQLAQQLRQLSVQACAVCFLFAFRNARHERLVAEELAKLGLQTTLSLSSEVQPEFREFERFSTTVLNAYLQPVMQSYVTTLEEEIRTLVPSATLGINQSSGGLMSAARTRDFPVRTALSGPAAGVMGAINSARQVGQANIITLDMGGTSADVALIRNLSASISFDRNVAGFPIRLPAIDIETVGAGGGSVAWFDKDGLLKVGPASAGANPGPACYGLGGTLPTVTDANLLLGRLSPKGLLNGAMKLDPALSRKAFSPLAEQLGFSIERTAHGVLGIVVANMVRTIRTISVERGHDPRKFALMPFGGAGPLHARDVAISLGITDILVPMAPGILCAQGLIVSDLKEDFVVTERVALNSDNGPTITRNVAVLASQAEQWFQGEEIAKEKRQVELSVDARYVGQNFELSVSLAQGSEIDLGQLPGSSSIKEAFLQAHELAYGYASETDPIEIINFRLVARGKLFAFEETETPAERSSAPIAADHRPVYFEPETSVDTPVFDRARLAPGDVIIGPAIIDQLDATTIIYPADRAMVSAGGNLQIRLKNQD